MAETLLPEPTGGASARQVSARYTGLVMSSETVSYSGKFGYIYRYDIFFSDPEKMSNDYKVDAILVVWSNDGEYVKLVTYPTYELPRG